MNDLQSEMRAEYRKRFYPGVADDFVSDEIIDSEIERTQFGAIIEVLCRLRRLDALNGALDEAVKMAVRDAKLVNSGDQEFRECMLALGAAEMKRNIPGYIGDYEIVDSDGATINIHVPLEVMQGSRESVNEYILNEYKRLRNGSAVQKTDFVTISKSLKACKKQIKCKHNFSVPDTYGRMTCNKCGFTTPQQGTQP